MKSKESFIVGYVFLRSSLTLENVGEILSDRIFGGIRFGGKDLDIHEEVPAIFIQSPIMGLKIILDEYCGDDEVRGFNLSIEPWDDISRGDCKPISLDNYLFELLKITLKDVSEIDVLKD